MRFLSDDLPVFVPTSYQYGNGMIRRLGDIFLIANTRLLCYIVTEK